MNIAVQLLPFKNTCVNILLHMPDSDSECPILQEHIKTAVFDTFPRPFNRSHPDHTAITLGCSHTFHAMALVYHWARNKNVLCPICRTGPKNHRLKMNALPDDWRFSMISKVKKEQRKDKLETELENYRMAAAISRDFSNSAQVSPVVRFGVKFELQAQLLGGNIQSWQLDAALSVRNNEVVFEVPSRYLASIPFCIGTVVRLVPHTFSAHTFNTLTPSDWFVMGGGNTSPSAGFTVEYNALEGFKGIKFLLSEDAFTALIVDAYFSTR
jgi:hypothetical protein